MTLMSDEEWRDELKYRISEVIGSVGSIYPEEVYGIIDNMPLLIGTTDADHEDIGIKVDVCQAEYKTYKGE